MDMHRRTGASVGQLSPDEFASAFQHNARPLWCIVAAVIGRTDLVEDVLQDAAMVALSKLDQFDPATSFLAWMGQIARFTALNHARRKSRDRTTGIDLDDRIGAAAPTDHPHGARGAIRSDGLIADAQQAFDDRVLAALHSLEDIARACLLLRSVLDMPYRTIALALSIPEGTAMSHVHRARHVMREKLNDFASQERQKARTTP